MYGKSMLWGPDHEHRYPELAEKVTFWDTKYLDIYMIFKVYMWTVTEGYYFDPFRHFSDKIRTKEDSKMLKYTETLILNLKIGTINRQIIRSDWNEKGTKNWLHLLSFIQWDPLPLPQCSFYMYSHNGFRATTLGFQVKHLWLKRWRSEF